MFGDTDNIRRDDLNAVKCVTTRVPDVRDGLNAGTTRARVLHALNQQIVSEQAANYHTPSSTAQAQRQQAQRRKAQRRARRLPGVGRGAPEPNAMPRDVNLRHSQKVAAGTSFPG